jgi:hypothetical protein
VVGLVAVLVLPWFQSLLTDVEIATESVRLTFLGVILAVSVLNFIPTRAWLAAAGVGCACAGELATVRGVIPPGLARIPVVDLLLAVSGWAGWLGFLVRKPAPTEADRLWLRLRDGWGFLWAHRMRDQFQRAAAHAGVNAHLRWSGFTKDSECEAAVRILVPLLMRFAPDHGPTGPIPGAPGAPMPPIPPMPLMPPEVGGGSLSKDSLRGSG